jgi:hypothetical protein
MSSKLANILFNNFIIIIYLSVKINNKPQISQPDDMLNPRSTERQEKHNMMI